ncbi:hypothetical protein BVI2075_720003 [Burkholderia vietnamiensis]|nr:hypothetical protein BVI2075_720003 [Burkholderia vietnamiensis]
MRAARQTRRLHGVQEQPSALDPRAAADQRNDRRRRDLRRAVADDAAARRVGLLRGAGRGDGRDVQAERPHQRRGDPGHVAGEAARDLRRRCRAVHEDHEIRLGLPGAGQHDGGRGVGEARRPADRRRAVAGRRPRDRQGARQQRERQRVRSRRDAGAGGGQADRPFADRRGARRRRADQQPPAVRRPAERAAVRAALAEVRHRLSGALPHLGSPACPLCGSRDSR